MKHLGNYLIFPRMQKRKTFFGLVFFFFFKDFIRVQGRNKIHALKKQRQRPSLQKDRLYCSSLGLNQKNVQVGI